MTTFDYFRGKKVTLVGLGLLGRGAGDTAFLARHGVKLTITDLKTAAELEPSLKKLRKLTKLKEAIRFTLGRHRLVDFRHCDLVITNGNIPLDSPFLAEARKNKIPITTSSALVVKHTPAITIGVTGTRGKSTTTHLIHHILKTAGQKVYLGGNVRGLSTLTLLDKAEGGDYLVLELDSWQLQGFKTEEVSPHIAVFINFLPDHLNYYQGSMERYFADKSNIYKFQKPSDHLIWGEKLKIRVPKSWKIKLLGAHNRKNIACAVAVAKILKIPDQIIKKSVESFRGVPGRLELVRTVRGVKIYNDTTSTTPDALLAGLRSFKKKVILIMGGADKNLDLKELARTLPKYCKHIILLPGTGTEKFKSQKLNLPAGKAGFKIASQKSNLSEAVKEAVKQAKRGDTVLFSPGFASFGLFKNEFDRGEQFNKIVKKL